MDLTRNFNEKREAERREREYQALQRRLNSPAFQRAVSAFQEDMATIARVYADKE